MTQCLESIAHGNETSAGNSKWPTQGVCAACTSFSYVSTVESFEDAALSVLCTGREACCLKNLNGLFGDIKYIGRISTSR
jgi:hypothetical protein